MYLPLSPCTRCQYSYDDETTNVDAVDDKCVSNIQKHDERKYSRPSKFLMALFDWLGGKALDFLSLYRLGSCVFVTVLSVRSGYNLQILVVVSEYENIIN